MQKKIREKMLSKIEVSFCGSVFTLNRVAGIECFENLSDVTVVFQRQTVKKSGKQLLNILKYI